MKANTTGWMRAVYSWWFFGILVLAQFLLMPIATQGYSVESIGSIIPYTLSHAWIQKMYAFSPLFQIVSLFFFALLIFGKGRFGKWFTAYVAVSYLLFAVIQNVAVSERFGISLVTSNIALMTLVALSWLSDLRQGKNVYDFSNLKAGKYGLLVISIFCFWWPLSSGIAHPDFNPLNFFTSGSSLAFCPMTPIFLTVLILCEPKVNPATYRITAIAGVIIGLWNMGNFGNASTLYVGIYHLPLLIISIYAVFRSQRLYNRIRRSAAGQNQLKEGYV